MRPDTGSQRDGCRMAGGRRAETQIGPQLTKNVLECQRWLTRQDLRLAITTWLEPTYHRRRRQRQLGYLTPVGYETIIWTAPTAPLVPKSTKAVSRDSLTSVLDKAALLRLAHQD